MFAWINQKLNEKITVRNIKQGDFFGEVEFFSGACYSYEAMSEGVSTVYSISVEDFKEKVNDKDLEIFHYYKDSLNLKY